MIFVSGSHGVGKTIFCNNISKKYRIPAYSSSKLIQKYKKEKFTENKRVADIIENQNYLVKAVEHLNKLNDIYILDGHFCLFNENGIITRIPLQTVEAIAPVAIILLIDSPINIVKRLFNKGNTNFNEAIIETLQDEEIIYSYEVSQKLHIPYMKFKIGDDMHRVYNFIDTLFVDKNNMN